MDVCLLGMLWEGVCTSFEAQCVFSYYPEGLLEVCVLVWSTLGVLLFSCSGPLASGYCSGELVPAGVKFVGAFQL